MAQQYFTAEQSLNVRAYSLQQELHKADLSLHLALALNDASKILACKSAIELLHQEQLKLKNKLVAEYYN